MIQDQADPAGLETGQSEQGEQVIVKRGLSHDLIVGGQRLHTDKPVVFHSVQVAGQEAVYVVL